LQARYCVADVEQLHSIVRASVGLGLHWIIERIKADTPELKITRVVKDEVRELAGISISSLDKYIGEAFQSDRPIDSTTLEKLAIKLFYQNSSATQQSVGSEPRHIDCDDLKYLQPHHLGALGNRTANQGAERLIGDLIDFIKTKPILKQFLVDNIQGAAYPELLQKVFELEVSPQASSVTPTASNVVSLGPALPKGPTAEPQFAESTHSQEGFDQTSSRVTARTSPTPLIVAFGASLLGVFLIVLVIFGSSADSALVLDYLVHDPGKHFFHIIIFPCMLWVFLRSASFEQLLSQKWLFWAMVSAGFVSSLAQTYIQHAQSICDFVSTNYVCNDIVERLFTSEGLDTLFFLYSSLLSALGSLLSIVVFVCQLLDIRNRASEICPPIIYALINGSYALWAVARSYSEWHETALSFEAKALSDFEVYQYQSSLMIITMLIVSQILVLVQVGRNQAIWVYLAFFAIVDICLLWFASNIQNIAPKLHSFDHTNFADIDYLPVIVGPIFYLYFIGILVMFFYATVYNKTRAGS